jgi:beta-galactosidase
VNADIVKPGDDLRKYKLVLAPHLHVLADEVANQLVEYVRDGGVLLTDCRTGVKDETNLAYARTLPGLLAPALGIEIEEYESLGLGITDKEATTYTIRADQQLGESYTAVHYADWITPTSGKLVARYDEPHLKEFAAVTRNELEKGIGWYVGTIVKEEEFYDKLMRRIIKDAKIQPVLDPPAGIEVAVRNSSNHDLLFIINHTAEDKSVPVPQGGRELITDEQPKESLTLGPFGVAVIELEQKGQ